jgi:hypothetical protein
MYPSKNVILCLFYASKQAKVLKKLLDVHPISHGSSIFTHIQMGGLGGSGGWGGKPLNRAKIHSRQKRGRLFADCQPYRPLSIFCLLQKM